MRRLMEEPGGAGRAGERRGNSPKAGPPAKRVVYVVAKAPRAGEAKTRLCPPLTPDQAARLAAAFVRDAAALVCRAGVDVRLICRDDDERRYLLPHAGPASVHVQQGTGLGAALESAFAQGLADGFEAVAVLGADSPTLPPAVVAEAFAALGRGADVALGPSDDGGYYLLASRRLYPQLFRDMTWSTSTVGAETLRRCAALALRPHLLPRWTDVDDAPSLTRLRASLGAAGADVAAHTRAALQELALGALGHAEYPGREAPERQRPWAGDAWRSGPLSGPIAGEPSPQAAFRVSTLPDDSRK